MTDIHTHLLPGLDDGPEIIAESLEVAQAAYSAGTRTIITTPHILNMLDTNRNNHIVSEYREFKDILEVECPGLNLLLGSEIYFRPNLAELVHHEVATLNGTGKYMLVEFSLTDIPKGFERELVNLRSQGVVPIIAHPERNIAALKKPSFIGRMIDAGGLIQLNSGSLTGSFGRPVRKLAHNLLKRGWVHFIASDTHGLNHRGPGLEAAISAAADVIGMAEARRLVDEYPEVVIEGREWPDNKALVSSVGGVK
ncbi:hypothetical protein CEE37_08680 [candidate division LCP-89 bacterium B3_LCP]|uniref:protein-tyrosine-phosphatase n=1 Tax=candidate division LCP-89 bacterium B3_LCP TaxID=2012998 RepID=A0A532V092_UNCL8|nr:MAG: hypothetical protein CEE37_08680 [candidate division LCP-89 bacterium B3_LCP]